MQSLDAAPFLDFTTPEFEANPATAIAAVRALSPLARTPIGALLSRGSPNSSLLPIIRMQGLVEGPVFDMVAGSLLAVDGVDHTRLRQLVSRAFTPRSVERLRPSMRALTEELVEHFAARRRCEFMADFADHYPIQMICELLGVPREDYGLFGRWANGLTWVLSFELNAHLAEIDAAAAGLGEYLDRFIESRRRAPEDDLVTRLIEAEDGGDRLSGNELRTMIGALLFAGYDTTRNQLGIAMTLFAQHPDQWRLLAAEPERVGAAVEEVLRFMGTVGVAPRVTREPVDVGDFHVPAGTLLTLSTSAANHDPAAYDHPERFDITVPREVPLTFGGGPHYCLGANLARAEMQEALAVLARRLRTLELDGVVGWRPRTGIFGPTQVPLRFIAAE
jgi:cytochrome P450